MALGRFSDQELETLSIDPRQPAGLSRCPWCGLDLVLGVRKTNGNVALAHQAHQDPTDPSRTRWISGCEAFLAVSKETDVMRRLYNAGARWQRLVPG